MVLTSSPWGQVPKDNFPQGPPLVTSHKSPQNPVKVPVARDFLVQTYGLCLKLKAGQARPKCHPIMGLGVVRVVRGQTPRKSKITFVWKISSCPPPPVRTGLVHKICVYFACCRQPSLELVAH